jgi:hypothetical protein
MFLFDLGKITSTTMDGTELIVADGYIATLSIRGSPLAPTRIRKISNSLHNQPLLKLKVYPLYPIIIPYPLEKGKKLSNKAILRKTGRNNPNSPFPHQKTALQGPEM